MNRYDFTGCANHTLIHGDSSVFIVEKAGLLILDPDWENWSEFDMSIMPKPPMNNIIAFTSPARLGEMLYTVRKKPTHIFAWDCRSAMESPCGPMMRLKLAVWFGDVRLYRKDAARYFKIDNQRGKRLQELFREDGYSISEVIERAGHAHAKPLPWITALIGAVHHAGLVFDPFAGSGTTLISCEELGKPSISIEKNSSHVDSIIRRVNEYKGLKTSLLTRGPE